MKILGYAVLQTNVKNVEIAKGPYFTNESNKTTAPAPNSTHFVTSTPATWCYILKNCVRHIFVLF